MKQTAPQFKLRLPDDLKGRVAAYAAENWRTIGAEILDALEAAYPPPADDLIAEAIDSAFGPRCADFDPGCHCCKAWAQYDALKAAQARGGAE